MEQRCSGSQQPELAPCYRNLLLRISRCTACWNRRRKLFLLGSGPPFHPPATLPLSFLVSSLLVSHPPHSPGVFPLPEGRVSRGDSLRVQDRTTPLYISIPQLRRRFSPWPDKKKGTLVRDDQPRETVARKGWAVDNVGNRPRRRRESHPLREGSRGISQLSRKYSRVPIHLSFAFFSFVLSFFFSFLPTARFSSGIYTRCVKIPAPSAARIERL